MPLAAPRLLLALLGMALGACASAATVETLTLDGKSVTVKVPTQPAAGRPWLWVGEFGGHLKSLEDGLVAQGWHVVYVSVSNQFGSARAMATWEKVYAELRAQRGLSARPALLGISRGGLYVTAWARRHPDRVSAIYGDAPVCDFKSWPGGKGTGPGSQADWQKLIRDYGFKDEPEALAFRGNPIDQLRPLAQAGIPLLHVVGDDDPVVPVPENTTIIEQRYKAAGGSMRVLHKPGVGHHPHGLDDPTPVVDFIRTAAKAAKSR